MDELASSSASVNYDYSQCFKCFHEQHANRCFIDAHIGGRFSSYKISLSNVMMPMGFAAIIGGMSTTIGTSTNLLVVGGRDIGIETFLCLIS